MDYILIRKQPLVIYSRKLKKHIPNPTRFWIVDKKLDKAISDLEAKGYIKKISDIVSSNDLLFNQLVDLHRKEIEVRKNLLENEKDIPDYMKKRLLDEKVGIGGIENFWEKPFKVKCLHLWTAYHLADKEFENFIGYFVLKSIRKGR